MISAKFTKRRAPASVVRGIAQMVVEDSFSSIEAVSSKVTSSGLSSFASMSRVSSFGRFIRRTRWDQAVTPGIGPFTV